jgi:hypothetical protein
MLENSFDVFVTFDQNIEHQQNFNRYPIKVLILIAPINTYEVLKNFESKISECLNNNFPEIKIIR